MVMIIMMMKEKEKKKKKGRYPRSGAFFVYDFLVILRSERFDTHRSR